MASVVDRLQAAKYTITGNDVSKIVGKSTTHEMGAPKRKHLDYLIGSTHEPNVSLPDCADMLLAKIQDPSWVVSIKAMMSLHHLMNEGNEKFMRYMASKGNSFEFVSEKEGPMAKEMSPFVHKYGHYLSEKCHCYRQATTDFVRISETNFLKQASADKLLAYLPILQRQVDGIVNLEIHSSDICTEISRATFILLFKDLIALFKVYNEGMINMLQLYFEMEKKHARESFDLYKKFIVRMGKIEQFLKVAEDAGIDQGDDVPDLSNAPSYLVSALENHLIALDKKGGSSTPISSPTTLNRSPNQPHRPTAGTPSATVDEFGATSPFGDSFDPPSLDLLSDPILVNTSDQTQPYLPTGPDMSLPDLWNTPKAVPIIHNNSNVVVEQSFEVFNSGQNSSNLFPTMSSNNQQAGSFDLLSGSQEQANTGFAEFDATETPSNDLLMPDKINSVSQEEKVQNVRSLMQDLDLGLKSAAANFSLSSSSAGRGGPAVGPVRPISAGATYNPFIRPGYPMMNNVPSNNLSMQGNMAMTNTMPAMNIGLHGNVLMGQSSATVGQMGQMSGTMNMMQATNQYPPVGPNSNLLQFNAMTSSSSGFGNSPQNNQQGQGSFNPFG